MKLLIVCASNICRSPYVEYLIRREVEKDEKLSKKFEWIKSSAVFNKMRKIHSKAKVALLDEGFSEKEIDNHKPSYLWFDYKRFKEADLIVGMTKMQKHLLPFSMRKKYTTLSEVAGLNYTKIPDPYLEKTQEGYNKVMKQIKEYVNEYIRKLKSEC